ncbi:MAG: hypothetical protein LBF38_00430 [Deltaproteobacteria bacterium]|jgi:hypothetical protein|nr:hypothetical protein [Deltaproteobacteria bacterium]
MLKKFALALVAVSFLALTALPLFAAGADINDENVKTFLVIYGNPDPQAVAAETAKLGDGAQDFGVLVTKIMTVHQMKKAGIDGDLLKTQLAGMPAPNTVTAAEIDVYNANEAELKKVLDAMTPGN